MKKGLGNGLELEKKLTKNIQYNSSFKEKSQILFPNLLDFENSLQKISNLPRQKKITYL
jgi:hypothetical protein